MAQTERGRAITIQVKIPIGPEDIGKTVEVISIKKLGIVTSFTADEVSVRILSEPKARNYKREDVRYSQKHLRH